MITRTSKARQPRLLPVCLWIRCRSAATVRGTLCEKHHRQALAMEPQRCETCGAWACGCEVKV